MENVCEKQHHLCNEYKIQFPCLLLEDSSDLFLVSMISKRLIFNIILLNNQGFLSFYFSFFPPTRCFNFINVESQRIFFCYIKVCISQFIAFLLFYFTLSLYLFFYPSFSLSSLVYLAGKTFSPE